MGTGEAWGVLEGFTWRVAGSAWLRGLSLTSLHRGPFQLT